MMRTSILLLALGVLPVLAGELEGVLLKGRTDRENPVGYAVGEKITFTLSFERWPAAVTNAYTVEWKRTGDDGKTESGSFAADPSRPFVYTTSMDRPGFMRLEASVKGEKNLMFDGGACAAVDSLSQGVPEPDDFDAFWARQRKRLDIVPPRVERTEIDVSNAAFRVYAVRIDCAGPRPVTGYLSMPRDAGLGKHYPAQIRYQGYGTNIQKPPKGGTPGFVLFEVNAHGYELGRDAVYYKDFLDGIRTPGYSYAFSPYQNENPEGSYFCGMALRAIRAAEYLASLPEWDGKTYWIVGNSQGGLQAIWAAAMAKGPTVAYPGITWLCDLGGFKAGRVQAQWHIPYVEALGYFDAVNHAKRAKVPVRISRAGLGDYTSPPSTLAVLYNALPLPKSITWVQGSQHMYVPPKPNQSFTVSAEGKKEKSK